MNRPLFTILGALVLVYGLVGLIMVVISHPGPLEVLWSAILVLVGGAIVAVAHRKTSP